MENPTNFLRIVMSLIQYHKMKNPIIRSLLQLSLSLRMWTWVSECVSKWGRETPYLYTSSDWPRTWLGWPLNLVGPTSPRETKKIHFIIFNWGTISPTYNKGFTSMTIYNNDISKGGKHIYDGGTTIYNDNIHQNVVQTYKYNNTLEVCALW